MFAPFPRAKRPRSPSPHTPDDYIDRRSPLDILIKRRRREAASRSDVYAQPGAYAYPSPPQEYAETLDQPESSTAWLSRPGVNGRRSRQWQHLNAPSSSQTNSTNQAITSISNSQPPPRSNFDDAHGSSPYSMEHGRAHSQPELPFSRQFGMSSSPIRHQAPGSSPFRASGVMAEVNGVVTPGSEVPPMEEEGWRDDELGREWGEYARENSVLYSIHKNRATSFATPPNPNSYMTMTPIRQHHPHQSYNPASYPAQYREPPPSCESTRFPQSSPFGGVAASDTTQIDYDDGEQTDIGEGGEDSGMEVLDDWPLTSQEAETRRRYEDANRLLAELAVARQRRWGDT